MTFTVLATGGEYKHKLTIEEMPSHSHKYILAYGANDPSYGFNYGNSVAGTFDPNWLLNTGGNKSHNNIHPHIVACLWRRTA